MGRPGENKAKAAALEGLDESEAMRSRLTACAVGVLSCAALLLALVERGGIGEGPMGTTTVLDVFAPEALRRAPWVQLSADPALEPNAPPVEGTFCCKAVPLPCCASAACCEAWETEGYQRQRCRWRSRTTGRHCTCTTSRPLSEQACSCVRPTTCAAFCAHGHSAVFSSTPSWPRLVKAVRWGRGLVLRA